MSTYNLRKGVQHFSPSYFALAMSTGIIAIASHLLGYPLISKNLFVLNRIEYFILAAVYIIRILFYFPDFKKDLSTHAAGAGFLTIVAATCILGVEYALLKNQFTTAIVFWNIALGLWLILIYSFFFLITTRRQKPSVEKGINGSWLLFIVSAQALSILGSTVSPYIGLPPSVMLFINLGFYLLGFIFYLIIIGIIFYRFTFRPMGEEDYKPSYWINMGAAAISTLAGPVLIRTIQELQTFQEFIPLIKMLTIFFWIAGTWWIPVIIFMEIWSHLKVPLQYHPRYWSMVFPLGVYTTCTLYLSNLLEVGFLKSVSEVTIYCAWAGWLTVFSGMIPVLIRHFFSNKQLSD